MYFLIKNDDLLEKHNAIWDKVSAGVRRLVDSEPVYNKNFLENQYKTSRWWSYRLLR